MSLETEIEELHRMGWSVRLYACREVRVSRGQGASEVAHKIRVGVGESLEDGVRKIRMAVQAVTRG